MVCFDFFFFKQKTAYEMRISDWSSDVCSSDLLFGDGGYFRGVLGADFRRIHADELGFVFCCQLKGSAQAARQAVVVAKMNGDASEHNEPPWVVADYCLQELSLHA